MLLQHHRSQFLSDWLSSISNAAVLPALYFYLRYLLCSDELKTGRKWSVSRGEFSAGVNLRFPEKTDATSRKSDGPRALASLIRHERRAATVQERLQLSDIRRKQGQWANWESVQPRELFRSDLLSPKVEKETFYDVYVFWTQYSCQKSPFDDCWLKITSNDWDINTCEKYFSNSIWKIPLKKTKLSNKKKWCINNFSHGTEIFDEDRVFKV